MGRIYRTIGFPGLWNGLPVRILMIGTLTAFQWLLYDTFKVTLGVGAPLFLVPAGQLNADADDDDDVVISYLLLEDIKIPPTSSLTGWTNIMTDTFFFFSGRYVSYLLWDRIHTDGRNPVRYVSCRVLYLTYSTDSTLLACLSVY